MRASGHRRWLGSAITALAVLMLAGPAVGITRFASPTGAGASPCAQATPCPIITAVNEAQAGDLVHLLPGNYATTGTLLGLVSDLTIEGEGTPGPLITYTPANVTFPAMQILGARWTLRNIRLTGTANTPILVNAVAGLGGLVDHVELRNLGTQDALIANSVTIRDSVIVASPTATTRAAVLDGTVTGSTIIANNLPTSHAIRVNGDNVPGNTANLTIRNSILRGGTADVELFGDFAGRIANVDIDYSAFRPGGIVKAGMSQGGLNITQGPHNVTAAPLLVNLAGGSDVHQLAGSPTIDVGDPAAAAGSTGDIDGDLRIIGSAPDIGADEVLTKPVATIGTATNVTATGATLNGTVNPAGIQTTYHFEYGPTTAYGSASPDVVIPAGLTNVAVTFDVAGLGVGATIHARLVATNAAGPATSADATITLASPPPPPPSDPPPANPKPDPIPVISAFTLRSGTFRIGPRPAGAPAKVKTGTAFTVTLSEAATVTFTIEKRTVGRRVAGTCRAATAANASRPSCVRFVFAGRITRSLAAGATITAFTGKAGTRKLTVGSYRVTAVAVDSATQQSSPRSATFKVVR
jgi:hypothetical protein